MDIQQLDRQPSAGRPAKRPAAAARPRPQADAERLASAAWRVLRRSGWRSLKIGSVLREANLSTRSFYRHFSSKNDLLLALMRAEAEKVVADLDAVLARHEHPAAKVEAWMNRLISYASADESAGRQRMFSSVWVEIEADFPGEAADLILLVVQPLAAVLRQGNAEGVFAAVDPESCARAIFYATMGAAAPLYLRLPTTREQEQRVITDFVLRALRMPRLEP